MLPITDKISYEKLVELVEHGREIEFSYKDDNYSITNTSKGFSLAKFYDNNIQTFKEPFELLTTAKVENKLIKEIWEEVTIDNIY